MILEKPNCDYRVSEWLDYLERRNPQEICLGLERVRKVASNLNLLKPNVPVITVAGTNGKGSVVAALTAIYSALGHQVASYTSPHLIKFNERIKIGQRPILDQDLIAGFHAIEEARGITELTYFETATLTALWHFKKVKADLIILEVGMGGRLDATNIIDADVAIITTIDFDHQAFLGTTLEAIAYEKAGILRSNRPFIYADKNPPQTIINQAASLNCKNYFYQEAYEYQTVGEELRFKFEGEIVLLPSSSLHPNSIAAAVMASLLLRSRLPLVSRTIFDALKGLTLSGRLQQIPGYATTLLDVSHNPQSVNYLGDYLKKENKKNPKRAVHAVFSALKDKDIEGLIAPLIPVVNYWYPTKIDSKRAILSDQLKLAFQQCDIMVPYCFETPVFAYQEACKKAEFGDLILVYGSFYTVGSVLSHISPPLEEIG